MASSNGHKPKEPKPMDHRCRGCGKLLFRAILPVGAYVETRCPRCSKMYLAGDTTSIYIDKIPETV